MTPTWQSIATVKAHLLTHKCHWSKWIKKMCWTHTYWFKMKKNCKMKKPSPSIFNRAIKFFSNFRIWVFYLNYWYFISDYLRSRCYSKLLSIQSQFHFTWQHITQIWTRTHITVCSPATKGNCIKITELYFKLHMNPFIIVRLVKKGKRKPNSCLKEQIHFQILAHNAEQIHPSEIHTYLKSTIITT